MRHARTRSVGLDGPQASIAVAAVATADGADVIDRGAVGTRPPDSDHLGRTRHATATPRVLVSEAGPCGDWRARALPPTGHRCWGVAPSPMPHQAGDRVKTDRRDAGPLARLRRSGALPPVDVPAGADDAIRDLARAREEAMRELKAAQVRLSAVLRRHARRAPGRAPGGPAHLRWRAEGVGATPAQPRVFQASVRAGHAHPARLPRLEQARQAHVTTGRRPPVVEARQAWRAVPGGRQPRRGRG